MNLNARIADELNDAFEKACIDRKVYKKQGVEVALQEFIESTGHSTPELPPVTCPICSSTFRTSPDGIEIISSGVTPCTVKAPPEMKEALEGVLDLLLNPGEHHEDYRDFLLKLLKKRAGYRNVSGL